MAGTVYVAIKFAVASQLSVALAVAVQAATKAASKHPNVRFVGGSVMTGAILSFTVITCVFNDALLHKSVADQVRVKVYLLGQLPLVRTSPR